MRLPERIVEELLDERILEGRALTGDALVKALLDEGWHFVSTPKWEQAESPDGGAVLQLGAVVDDTLINETRQISKWERASAGRSYFAHMKYDMTHGVTRVIGQKLGLLEVTS